MFDETLKMIHDATTQGHGSAIMIIMLGVAFGAIIQYTRADKFEKIAGFSLLEDTVIPKMLFLTIGLSSIGLFFLQENNLAHSHIKPIMLGGLVLGGIIFGVAMAILGKCPGTGPISIAEGRIDVLVGAVGGLLGGLVFILYYPFFKIFMGDELGKISLSAIAGDFEPYVVLLFGLLLIIISMKIPLREYKDEKEDF